MNYVSACLVVIGCLFSDPLGQLPAAKKDVVYEKFNGAKNRTVLQTRSNTTQIIEGKTSWYGQEYCDKYSPACITASGEPFREMALTAACHPRWKLGTILRIRYANNTVDIWCNDRGSFSGKYGRILDLSKGSFQRLAPLSKGVIQVQIEVIK